MVDHKHLVRAWADRQRVVSALRTLRVALAPRTLRVALALRTLRVALLGKAGREQLRRSLAVALPWVGRAASRESLRAAHRRRPPRLDLAPSLPRTDSSPAADFRRAHAPRQKGAGLRGARVAVVPSRDALVAELAAGADHPEDYPKLAVEVRPGDQAARLAVPNPPVPPRVAEPSARRVERLALALHTKHKTYLLDGFGSRTAGTRSSFLRLTPTA